LPVYQEVFPKGMIKVEMGDIKKFAGEVLNLLNNENFMIKFPKRQWIMPLDTIGVKLLKENLD